MCIRGVRVAIIGWIVYTFVGLFDDGVVDYFFLSKFYFMCTIV